MYKKDIVFFCTNSFINQSFLIIKMGIFSYILGANRNLIFGYSIPVFLGEIIDLIIMSLAIGFIFKDFIKPKFQNYDPIKHFKTKGNIKFAIYAVAPAIVLHELGHKFIAIFLGVDATFFASYGFLLIGVILKLMGSGIIFFVPGYVTHASVTGIKLTLIAFA